MPQLIRTNDGLIGWKKDKKLIWCDSIAEAYSIGFGLFAKTLDPADRNFFLCEVDTALKYMKEYNHEVAEFGVLGSFMYTTEIAS